MDATSKSSLPFTCYCLQGAQRRALDMINTVGLSESLLRVIERRQRGDILLTYGGMVGTEYFLAEISLISHMYDCESRSLVHHHTLLLMRFT